MMAAEIAVPGDPDLDLDIDGVTITSVIALGCEILISAKGGFGSWVDADGEVSVFPPGDESSGITDVEIAVGWHDSEKTRVYVKAMTTLLCRWRDQEVPLHMCCAPGKMSSLIEDANIWVPLPRSEPGL
jgi:hypothetical protein